MWIWIGGRKHCSAVLERHGWAFWQPNPEPRQREERGGVLAPLEGMCYIHCLSGITPTWPSQLNCFLTGPEGIWGHQSSLLRLDGSLPSQLIQCYVYTLYQTLGAPFCITSALVFFIHLIFHSCYAVSAICDGHSASYFTAKSVVFPNTMYHLRMTSNVVFFMKPSLIPVFIHSCIHCF